MVTGNRQVLLICDFGPPLPNNLLSLYEKMGDTYVTLIRRKYYNLGPTRFRVIQIPLTVTVKKRNRLRTFADLASYLLAGSVVALTATLRYRCTIIHSRFLVPEGIVGLVASVFSRSTLFVTAEGSDVNIHSRNPLARAMITMMASRGTITSVSVPIQARLSSMGVDSVYTPNFVDDSEFKFVPVDRKEHFLLFVGSLIQLKRPDLLIGAVAAIPRELLPRDFRVRMIGAGPLEASLAAMIGERGLGGMVSLDGRVSHGAVRDLMARALIYVSSSTMEGASVALIEAMASGCVVIASDIPGNSAIIHDRENGLLFPQGDSAALSRAIEEALNDQALCERLANGARRTFEVNFDIASSAKLLSRLYAETELPSPSKRQ